MFSMESYILIEQEDIGIEVNEAGNAELTIDWDDDDTETTSKSAAEANDDGVARGKDALTVLDNPSTRFQFIDELSEVSTFLSY